MLLLRSIAYAKGLLMWIDDHILERCAEPLALSVFLPDMRYVVLGSSNRIDHEVNEVNCLQDNVPILRRYGGGGTVLLYPGCLVLSLGTWVKDYYENKKYFNLINDAAIQTLGRIDSIFKGLTQSGLSDIDFNGRKVCGTSLFRSRNYLLYQASFLIDLDLAAIDRYLRHPSREPDYRQGRSHGEFLTSLGEILPGLSGAQLVRHFIDCFPGIFREHLAPWAVSPIQDQQKQLRDRVARITPPVEAKGC